MFQLKYFSVILVQSQTLYSLELLKTQIISFTRFEPIKHFFLFCLSTVKEKVYVNVDQQLLKAHVEECRNITADVLHTL